MKWFVKLFVYVRIFLVYLEGMKYRCWILVKLYINEIYKWRYNYFTAKSGAPGVPQVDNVGKTFVDLKWDKPKNDGGAKITG